MSDHELLFQADGASALARGDVLLTYWYADVTLRTFRDFAAVQRSYARGKPRGYHVISIVDVQRASRIDPDAKEASDQHLREMTPTMRSSCHVILGGGFTAAAARLIMTGQHLIQVVPFPWKIASSAAEACAWTAKHAGVQATDLERAAAALLGDRAPR